MGTQEIKNQPLFNHLSPSSEKMLKRELGDEEMVDTNADLISDRISCEY